MNRKFIFGCGGPFGKHDNAVRKGNGFRQVVCDENCCFSGVSDNIADVRGHGHPSLKIQCAERFIQQQQVGFYSHCTDESGTLAHSAGQLGWFFVLKGIEPVVLQKLYNKIYIFFCHIFI